MVEARRLILDGTLVTQAAHQAMAQVLTKSRRLYTLARRVEQQTDGAIATSYEPSSWTSSTEDYARKGHQGCRQGLKGSTPPWRERNSKSERSTPTSTIPKSHRLQC
eukprot:3152729-Amphidinium_carterae.1